MRLHKHNTLKIIGATLFSFCFLRARTQSSDTFRISGVIVSANSGKYVPYGAVSLENGKKITCDERGRFSFTNLQPGEKKLSFQTFAFDKFDTTLNISGNSIENFIWKVYPKCWKYSTESAQKHIKFNDVGIEVPSGSSPVVNTSEEQFKKEFNVHFNYYTIKESDITKECVIAANKITFEYLDKKFGEKFRSKIKKEILQLDYSEVNVRESLLGELTIEDTSIMSKAINLFRTDLNANYWLVRKSYDDKYKESPKFIAAALRKLETIKNLSTNSKLEITEATKIFKNVDLIDFNHALVVAINSNYMDLLCGVNYVEADYRTDVSSSNQKGGKTKEESEKETLDFYKRSQELDEAKVIEVSEPFYDRVRTNAIVILTIYKYRVAETHLVLFKKEAKLWRNTEKHICARLSR